MGIGIVIVTFNRLEKLKTSLQSFDKQDCQPEYVLVVNNASNDGTLEYLETWRNENKDYRKYVINKPSNTGGSGGFYTGLKEAMKLDAQWIWVSDDDAFPKEDALLVAEKYLSKEKDWNSISAICCKVVNNGAIDLTHRRWIRTGFLKIHDIPVEEEEYEKEFFTINAFSYVGTIINKEKLKEVGITSKDYFIWCDDTEHSLRLSKVGRIICLPQMTVYHDINENIELVSWKTYYGQRNWTDLCKKHLPTKNYIYHCASRIIKSYARDVLGRKREYNIVERSGIKDAMRGKMGIHEIYKPGWRPNTK